ncbi:MAG: RNA polymerase sigma factor, partial [Candidatus Eremiobacteraeota bacterium]|nr:RNA polymerase sigma factor [Candidatus Eremiobacteraeota bacterium]
MSEPSAPVAEHDDWGTVMQREYPRVVSIASKIVGSEEALDIAQEVFAEASRRHGGVTAGFLHLAAAHRALNALRSRRRRLLRELSYFRLNLSLRSRPADPAD